MNLSEVVKDLSEHRKEISELKFLEILKEKALNSHGVIKLTPIFREDKGSDFMLVSPREKESKSSFWIDKIIKDMRSWSRFPDRSRCLKGYTSIDRLGGDESDHYVIIPLDRSRVGVCPSSSFYKSFKSLKKIGIERVDNDSLSSWLNLLSNGLATINPDLNIKITEVESLTQFRSALSKIDSEIKGKIESLKKKSRESDEINDDEKIVVDDLLSRYVTSCERYLEEKFDPETNEFSTLKIESFSNVKSEREVWIEDSCLLIRRNRYIELYKRGSIK